MSDREVMKLALEALKAMQSYAAAERKGLRICDEAIEALRTHLAAPRPEPVAFGYLWPTGMHPEFRFTQQKRDGVDGMPVYAAPPAAAPQPESKTPAWWMDGLTATLMREGVNKHRAREIAQGYWEAYCQIPGQEEDKT